jgi:glycosyltransferase involved in cell wall biosynthesis
VHLDILGDGPNRQKIQEKIDSLNLNEHITLHGNVGRVEDFLHRAHIYVHSAIYEPFGLVLLEAMAAGLPCVMLDGKGNRDIAEDGKNGFLVNEVDPSRFADRIVKLASDQSLYERLSNYASSFASKFDIKGYVTRLLSLYRGITD